jgi:PucR C-terminal helix-turn-helix domain/GGDEF-like domain
MSSARDTERGAMWEALLKASLEDRHELVSRIADQIRNALPSYRGVPDELLGAGFSLEFERVLRAALAHGTHVSDEQLAGLAEVGEARALQRVPLGDMLLAWRIGVQVVLTHSRATADRLGIPPEHTLEYVQALLRWSDRAMVIMASAHRQAELDIARRDVEDRAETVRAALLGTLRPVELRHRAERAGLDVTREHITVCCRLTDRVEPAALERGLGFHETVSPRRGLSTTLDGHLVGILRSAPDSDLGEPVGTGPPRPIERLAESFPLAQRAARTASAFNLSGIHSFESLGLLPSVVDDPHVGETLHRRYLDPLTGSAAEIADTLRAYFASQTNVERAADTLDIHPNTLRYRLGRFEELTGAALRDPITAFEVWWALQYDSIGSTRASAEG